MHARPRRRGADIEQPRSDGDRQREQRVDHVAAAARRIADGHQGADRHRIEWLVQKDDDEGRQAGERDGPGQLAFSFDTRGQRHAIGQAVKRQADRGSAPAQTLLSLDVVSFVAVRLMAVQFAVPMMVIVTVRV